MPLEVQVLDTQLQALEETQSAAIQQRYHQVRHTAHPRQHPADLVARQHHRQPPGPPRPLAQRNLRQRPPKHLLVQEQQRAQRLVLRRGRDVPAIRQMLEKPRHLGLPHLHRVPLPVEQDVPPDPPDIRLLGATAVVARTDGQAHTIEQLRRTCGVGHAGRWCEPHAVVISAKTGEKSIVHRQGRRRRRRTCRITRKRGSKKRRSHQVGAIARSGRAALRSPGC
jgi:hypothetical protein